MISADDYAFDVTLTFSFPVGRGAPAEVVDAFASYLDEKGREHEGPRTTVKGEPTVKRSGSGRSTVGIKMTCREGLDVAESTLTSLTTDAAAFWKKYGDKYPLPSLA